MPDPDVNRPSSRAAVLVVALGLAVASLAIWLWPRTGVASPGAPSAPDAPAPVEPDVGGPIAATGGAADGPPPEAPPALERIAPPTGAIHPQGLRGRVLDAASARPLGGVAVYLVESAQNDPLLLPLVAQQRHLLAPIATTRTAADGTFAVGLLVAQDRTYEVLVASPDHATLRRGGLRLLPDVWHDLGDLTLDAGATLRGRVTIAGRPELPVPQATVTVETGGAFADAALRALPDDAGALTAQVDGNGYYELRRVPTRGVVRVSAVAPGFARVTRHDVEMQADAPVTVDLALPPGRSLVGEVRTVDGEPIADARVEAWPELVGEPPLIGFSDQRGAFAVEGLLAGKYLVRARARGFAQTERNGVEPGAPLRLVLQPRGRIEVTVRTPTGAVLRAYRLGLRRFFPADLDAPLDQAAVDDPKSRVGAIHEVSDRRVRLAPGDLHAEIDAVPEGTFVCEVEAPGFAKVLSVPVRFPGPDGRLDTVERIAVTVHRGATLRGIVHDAAGRPLADAVVETQPDGTMADSPVLRMFQSAVPPRITRRTTRTDAAGRFALDRLALGTYQLQVEHPAGCRQVVRGVDCTQPFERTLPPVVLRAGSLVRGRATVDGRIVGQMKLVLTTPPETPADQSIRLETVTDGEGRYGFARRIPPGTYVLRAAVVGARDPDAEAFQQLLQLERSTISVQVPPGRDAVEQNIDLPAEN